MIFIDVGIFPHFNSIKTYRAHIIFFNFSRRLIPLLTELCKAYENEKQSFVVVSNEEPLVVMEKIKNVIKIPKNITILARKGYAWQKSLLDKINFTDFDQTYYKDLPIQPGVSFFKWLTPRTNSKSKHAHAIRMPGLNAVKLQIPETVVYSERYMGIPEVWVGTDPKDGCVVKRRVNLKDWRVKFAKKAVNGAIWGVSSGSLSPSKRKRRKGHKKCWTE